MPATTANYRHMTAKFNGKCGDCARFLPAGSEIIYNFDIRKAYCSDVEDCYHACEARKAETAPVAPGFEPAEITGTATVTKGYYTVAMEDGSHVTIRLRPHWEDDKAERGVLVAGYLSGSNNEADYTGFAFVDGNRVTVWGRFRTGHERQKLALGILVADKSAAAVAGKAYAMESSKCFVCNRTLTTPESIEHGIGPECRAKGGW